MESLVSTACMFTDTQLTFLNDLEELVTDNYFSITKENESNETKSPQLHDDRAELEMHFQKLLIEPLDQNERRMKSLLNQQKQCATLLAAVDHVLQQLEELKAQHGAALTKTGPVHSQCESIAKQQQDLLHAVDTLEFNLTSFRKYERLHTSLTAVSLDRLIESGQLPLLLDEMDDCIGFIQTHPNYVETPQFSEKFAQLQNSTLAMVKNEVLLQFQLQTAKIVPQANDQLAPGENVFTLFYAKFQQFAQRVRPLLVNLEKRRHLDETSQSYLNECYQAYANSRQSLIVPVLMMALRELIASTSTGNLQSVRNSARMVFQMCRDELQLYSNFFEHSSAPLTELIETLCNTLYDLLRPLVIKCNHLETLAEIGHILKSEVVEEDAVAAHVELAAFVKIVDLLVQDVQERLIFRANVFIQTEILGYNPAAGDLAYPEKLAMLGLSDHDRSDDLPRNSNNALHTPSVGGLSRSYSITSMAASVMSSNTFSDVTLMPFDMSNDRYAPNEGLGYHLWYPTVRRAIMCLTKLFRTLDTSTFQALAQDVIVACIQTLDVAAVRIKARTKSSLDADLFMIKHLLIIREQIAPFKIECTVREVSLDFSRVKDAAMSLFHKGNTIFSISTNNGLLSFLFEMQSSAQIVDQVLDSQKTVDTRIRTTCQKLIDECASLLSRRVEQLRDHLPDIDKSPGNDTSVLASDHELDPAKNPENRHADLEDEKIKMVQQQINQMLNDLRQQVNEIRSSMSLYLCNEETESILFKPIKSKLLKSLETLEKQIRLILTSEQLAGIQSNVASWIKLATQYSS